MAQPGARRANFSSQADNTPRRQDLHLGDDEKEEKEDYTLRNKEKKRIEGILIERKSIKFQIKSIKFQIKQKKRK